MRATRTEVLRSLALKQKIKSNPKLFVKLPKQKSPRLKDFLQQEPIILKGRVRDRRGVYQSIDATVVPDKPFATIQTGRTEHSPNNLE